MCESFRVILQT